MKLISRILDSSSDISRSAPSSISSTDSSTNTSQTHNVTPVTPSKRPRSYISETSSSSTLNRPPISEIPITTRTQPTTTNTPLVHIPHPETVEQYVNYKHPTAIKTVRLQPQLNLVHIPDTEYTRLPPLKLPSELSTTSSKLYPTLKPLRKPSTSLSNLLDNTSEYTTSQETSSSLFIPQHRYNLRDLPSRRLSTDTLKHYIHPLFLATLHYALYGNTHNHYPLKHILQNSYLLLILRLVLTQLHYSLLTLKLHSYLSFRSYNTYSCSSTC